MRKEERHQIKRDDLATLLERAGLFIEDNLRSVVLSAAVLALLVVAGLTLRGWLSSREQRSSLLLGELIETFATPASPSPEERQQLPVGVPSFASASERDSKVLEQAEAILARHGSASVAPKALYYKALALADLRRYDEAAAALDEILMKYSRDFLAPMARYQLARMREVQGKPNEAIVQFQVLTETSGGLFPREEALLGIARCQEAMGQRAEALKTYMRILDEFPESEYLGEARNKVQELS